MLVREIMSVGVECVRPQTTLQEAAQKMRQHDVGLLPICDKDRVLGVITDRDITVRATAEGRDSEIATVRAAMTNSAICCLEDDDVVTAATLMRTHQVRRLLVLSHEQQLVGIVSLGDLAIAARNANLAGQTLEGISEPLWAFQS
jgi:CBS domain-containing protein